MISHTYTENVSTNFFFRSSFDHTDTETVQDLLAFYDLRMNLKEIRFNFSNLKPFKKMLEKNKNQYRFLEIKKKMFVNNTKPKSNEIC